MNSPTELDLRETARPNQGACYDSHAEALKADISFLHANNEAYEWIVAKIQEQDGNTSDEVLLREIEKAAACANMFHTGRFADGAIENIALRIGAEFGTSDPKDQKAGASKAVYSTRRHVLHVATDVMAVGGHTRMIHQWISSDADSGHSLLLVNQRDAQIPVWLTEAVESSGGTLMKLPTEQCIREKARILREFARKCATLVVLHHHGFDVVPTVAFATPDCPPVAVLNHADHLFWLGSSVADIVINLRRITEEHCFQRRELPRSIVLPVPLADLTTPIARESARHTLRIPETSTVLLSIGRAEKFRPCGTYDFVATAGRILDGLPDAHLYAVGVTESDLSPFLRGKIHERLHLVGTIEDPACYRAAADVYLETFPFGSQTAMLESALSGLPVVSAYAPLFHLLVANDGFVEDLTPNPATEEEYIERVRTFALSADRRASLGQELRKRLQATHVDDGWRQQLARIYEVTDVLEHRSRKISVTSRCESGADVGLSLWHAISRKAAAALHEHDAIEMVLHHRVTVAKAVGHNAMARRYAWKAVCRNPRRIENWRSWAVALLGRRSRVMKRVLGKLGR